MHEDLGALRSRVLGKLPGRRPRWAWPAWLSTPLRLEPAVAALVAGAVFVGGVAAGWAGLEREGVRERLVREITAEAAANHSLGDVEDSPYTYSNVAFRRLEDDRVALAFDLTTHVDLVEPVRSEVVKEVLAQSLLNPGDTGMRLKALSYATRAMGPKVRDSLIIAMHHDDNLAVRLKALSILAALPADDAIETAVLQSLREDGAVQIRLEALDYLAEQRVDPDALRRAIEHGDDRANAALMVRLTERGRGTDE
jgi:hypothetical protein